MDDAGSARATFTRPPPGPGWPYGNTFLAFELPVPALFHVQQDHSPYVYCMGRL